MGNRKELISSTIQLHNTREFLVTQKSKLVKVSTITLTFEIFKTYKVNKLPKLQLLHKCFIATIVKVFQFIIYGRVK